MGQTADHHAMGIKEQFQNLAKRFLFFITAILILIVAGVWFLMANSKLERMGELDGISEKYYWMGKLLGERHYRSGKLDGVTRTFYGDGQVKGEWLFQEDKMDGTSRHFRKDGTISFEEIYEGGQRIKRVNYNNDGKITSEENYKK
ncbi:MAG: hypothetical protein HYZ83_06615 [Candidatus Omnitrophica bacterium]|nr:hypothetical protein [Candidatus Omnitrophota bacterium]